VNQLRYEFSMLSSVALLRTRLQVVLPEFLAGYLNFPTVFRAITSQMKGGAIKRLTIERIRELRVVAPPIGLQEKYAEAVERHRQATRTRCESLRQAEHLFQSLLNQYFGGEN
jgi:type I restriction enzyme S subunit